MSSAKSNSTEVNPGTPGPGPTRSSIALVVVTLALLGVLVWALSPSRPDWVPAPLGPPPQGCPKSGQEFTPTNLTEIPGLSLQGISEQQKYRALLRLNMEPCPCGCNQSIASCRSDNPTCETSKDLAKKIIAEEAAARAEKR